MGYNVGKKKGSPGWGKNEGQNGEVERGNLPRGVPVLKRLFVIQRILKIM